MTKNENTDVYQLGLIWRSVVAPSSVKVTLRSKSVILFSRIGKLEIRMKLIKIVKKCLRAWIQMKNKSSVYRNQTIDLSC